MNFPVRSARSVFKRVILLLESDKTLRRGTATPSLRRRQQCESHKAVGCLIRERMEQNGSIMLKISVVEPMPRASVRYRNDSKAGGSFPASEGHNEGPAKGCVISTHSSETPIGVFIISVLERLGQAFCQTQIQDRSYRCSVRSDCSMTCNCTRCSRPSCRGVGSCQASGTSASFDSSSS